MPKPNAAAENLKTKTREKMNTLLAFLLLCLYVSPLYSMERNGQRLYPLLPVLQANAQQADEQAHLLMQDFFEKDGQTLMLANPPSYDQLYISKAASEAELTTLRDLLAKKEEELETVSKRLPRTLSMLERQRKLENHNSNIGMSSAAGIFYLVDTIGLVFAVPYPTKDDNTKIMLYCLHGLASAVASGFVAVVNAGEKEHT